MKLRLMEKKKQQQQKLKERERRERRERAAICLQSVARSMPCRARLHAIQHAVRLLQVWQLRRLLSNRLYKRKRARLEKERLEEEERIFRLHQKKKKEEEGAKEAERQRIKTEERHAVKLQSFGRRYLAEKKYAATLRGAYSGQSMYRVWSAKRKLMRKKHQKKERERCAKKRQRRGAHPETRSSSLKPALPLIHKKQQQASLRPSRGRLRTSGWNEETLNSRGTVYGRVPVRVPVRSSSSSASRDQLILGEGQDKIKQEMQSQVNLPGIQPNRAYTQSAPGLTGTSSSHGNNRNTITDDALRAAWTNARQSRDSIVRQNDQHANRGKRVPPVHQMRDGRFRQRGHPANKVEEDAEDAEGEGEEQPRWNSLFHIKNQYESNAVSIRNRMLRGIKPTTRSKR
jgi:hypothetical protein